MRRCEAIWTAPSVAWNHSRKPRVRCVSPRAGGGPSGSTSWDRPAVMISRWLGKRSPAEITTAHLALPAMRLRWLLAPCRKRKCAFANVGELSNVGDSKNCRGGCHRSFFHAVVGFPSARRAGQVPPAPAAAWAPPSAPVHLVPVAVQVPDFDDPAGRLIDRRSSRTRSASLRRFAWRNCLGWRKHVERNQRSRRGTADQTDVRGSVRADPYAPSNLM